MFLIPDFKGYDFFPHGTRINFMRVKGLCLTLSLVFSIAAALAIGVLGFNYGVDFKGGTLIEVKSTTGPADIQDLRRKLGDLGLGSVQIQAFNDADVLIRVEPSRCARMLKQQQCVEPENFRVAPEQAQQQPRQPDRFLT